jgi:hypothetical protein
MLVYPTLNNQGGTKLFTISHNIHMSHYGPNSKSGRVWHGGRWNSDSATEVGPDAWMTAFWLLRALALPLGLQYWAEKIHGLCRVSGPTTRACALQAWAANPPLCEMAGFQYWWIFECSGTLRFFNVFFFCCGSLPEGRNSVYCPVLFPNLTEQR